MRVTGTRLWPYDTLDPFDGILAMKKFSTISLLALTAIALTGCQQAPSLVGTWKMSNPITSQGLTISESTQTFNADNTFTSNATMSVMGNSVKMDIKGTYSVAEKTLSTTVSDVSINGQPVDLKNPAFAQMSQNLNSSMTFEFSGNDSLTTTTTAENVSAKWTRVK